MPVQRHEPEQQAALAPGQLLVDPAAGNGRAQRAEEAELRHQRVVDSGRIAALESGHVADVSHVAIVADLSRTGRRCDSTKTGRHSMSTPTSYVARTVTVVSSGCCSS